jgi:hypothetical protein
MADTNVVVEDTTPVDNSLDEFLSWNGTIKLAEFCRHPTQDTMVRFVKKYGERVRSLSMKLDYTEENEPIDFQHLVLPNLENLNLKDVFVKNLHLTSTNTPLLASIFLSNIHGYMKLFLELPNLISFYAEHTHVHGETKNSFGLSISRCPNLEHIETYKFRGLTGSNFCVLPKCEHFELWRSECTDSLEILSAPNLSHLSVEDAYGLTHLRLYDFLGATLQDVEELCGLEMTIHADAERYTNQARATISAKSTEELKQFAIEKNWIDIDDEEGFDPNDDDFGTEMLNEYLWNLKTEKIASLRRERIQPCLSSIKLKAPLENLDAEKLPQCKVITTNMDLDMFSKKHLASHSRISCDGMSSEEDEEEEEGEPNNSHPVVMMIEMIMPSIVIQESTGEDEYVPNSFSVDGTALTMTFTARHKSDGTEFQKTTPIPPVILGLMNDHSVEKITFR